MASLKDVAKLAGVSLMTVSRAINEPGKLRPETYRRVKQAIDQLDYVPDLSARRIRGDGNRVQTLGVLALDTATTPFSVEMILSIENRARARLEQLRRQPVCRRQRRTDRRFAAGASS